MATYHRVITVNYEGESVSLTLRNGLKSKEIQDAIRDSFDLSPNSRLLLIDNEGDDAVIDSSLPTGHYVLHVHSDRDKKGTGKSSKKSAPKWSLRRTICDNDMGPAITLLKDGRLATTAQAKAIRLWNLDDEDAAPEILNGHWNIVLDLATLESGHLVSAGGDWSIRIWDVNKNIALHTIKYDSKKKYKSKLISVTKETFLTGADDFKENLELWDAETGKEVRKFSGHSHMITALTSLKGGERFASTSFDRTLKIWDIKSGECIKTIESDANIHALNSFRDGKLIVNEDNEIHIWDASFTKPITKLVGHTKDVRTITVLNDSSLASGGDDQTILVWELGKSQPIVTLKSHTARVNTLQTLYGDNTLASGSFDRSIKIWV